MDASLKFWAARLRNRHIFLLDLILIVVSVWASFALALGWSEILPTYAHPLLSMMLLSLVIKPVVYHLAGMYRRIWTYASVDELKLIARAVTAASLIIAPIMLGAFYLGWLTALPRSALGIDWLISLLMAGGVRFMLRVLSESSGPAARTGKTRRVLVVGAGSAGALVVRELQKNRQMNLTPIGFLDDDPAKQAHQIYGVPVIGMLADLPAVLDKQHVDEVIVAIPSAPGRVLRPLADICRLKGVPFRTMPGIYELLGGRVSVSRLREVEVTDLLRRQPASIREDMVASLLSGKRILVTGAGGSIGSEICRQMSRWNPAELTLLGHGENSIFEILLELRDNFPSLTIHPVIADVRDEARLREAFLRLRPQVIFHAAAHKHVSLMEANVAEAVMNNVVGTRNVVNIALEADVERLVLISTDKAVRPANVYGATKRLAEMIVLDAARRTGKPYTVVRFGNVLGSRGSVIPIFKKQIARGGPIRITHPDMARYFMTIPEAVHLVLQASSMGQGGELFLLNMGEQVRIRDLAEDLIRLSGLEPGRDIEIVYTGIQPGEKLREQLYDDGAPYEQTAHPDIFRLTSEEALQGERLTQVIEALTGLAARADSQGIIRLLDDVVPGASIQSTPPPEDITSVV